MSFLVYPVVSALFGWLVGRFIYWPVAAGLCAYLGWVIFDYYLLEEAVEKTTMSDLISVWFVIAEVAMALGLLQKRAYLNRHGWHRAE